MRALKLVLRLALLGVGITSAAHAQSYLSPNPPQHGVDDRFRLEVDLFYGSYASNLRLDKATTTGGVTTITPGTTLSGEKDLGMNKTQWLPQLELTLLPAQHHMVRLSGLSMQRDGVSTLTGTVHFGNDTYTANDLANSHLNLSMIGLTYGYLPFRTDRYELGVSFGVQIASVDTNVEVRAKGTRDTESGVAPVPLFGVEGRFDFTRRWSVDGRFQYLTLSVFESLGLDLSNVKGTVTDGRFALRWRQNQHLLYGLGYHYFSIDASSQQTGTPGAVQLKLSGPMLFVQGSL